MEILDCLLFFYFFHVELVLSQLSACKLESCTKELTSFICKPSKTDKVTNDGEVVKCLNMGRILKIDCTIPNDILRYRKKYAKFMKNDKRYKNINILSIVLKAKDVRVFKENNGSLLINSCHQFPIFVIGMNRSIEMNEILLNQVFFSLIVLLTCISH